MFLKAIVSKGKNQAIFAGVEQLKVQYKGSKSYLSLSQKKEIVQWLQSQAYCEREKLQLYIEANYGVIFQSLQSYYELLHQSKISWKKTQKINPSKDPELVKKKQEEIRTQLADWQVEIEAGTLAVFMIDECHLLWGNLIGYAWGKTDMRVEVPLKNQKEKQTYYGALDYQTKEFIIQEYPTANSENTQKFLDYLQAQRPGKRIVVIWDGATYHRSEEFRIYLDKVNQNLKPEDWQITCLRFAPNAPEQNPVEDIWLQTKNFVRRFYHLAKSFKVVKWLFKFFANGQIFDFPKAFEYAPLPQPI